MGLSRSEQMSRIRGRDTHPEKLLRTMVWSAGLRYRLHARTPAGRPDLVFPGKRVAVFVDGCFWHGCPEHYVCPRSSSGFWARKLRENVGRDERQTGQLEELGWRVVRIWEHEIFESPGVVIESIEAAVQGKRWRPPQSWRVVAVDEVTRQPPLERRFMRELRGVQEPKFIERLRSTTKWKMTRPGVT